MNKEQLNAIKERALNATDGPWQVYEMEDGTHIGTAEHHPQLKSPMHVVTMSYWGDKPHSRVFIDKDNAEFIKHAITDVPALVAEVERLMKGMHQLREYISLTKHSDDLENINGILWSIMQGGEADE